MGGRAQPRRRRAADEGRGQPGARAGRDDRLELGQRGDISKIALAREIGLDGIQVSLQFPTDGKTPTLRDPKTQAAFRRAALDNGIQICSLAIGSPGKSRLPLHTNPAAAILLVEAVEVARNLGTNNILLPILGDSHIDMTNQAQVDTFVAMMKEVARYAEKYDVVVGIEDWISAEDNIKLLDAIGSEYVAVYYDAHNIVAAGVKDIYAEPKMLGKRINQIHVKNADMLLSTPGGRIDWPRMAQEFYDIGYRGSGGRGRQRCPIRSTWVQRSAEYHAAVIQVYRLATGRWSSRPGPAPRNMGGHPGRR